MDDPVLPAIPPSQPTRYYDGIGIAEQRRILAAMKRKRTADRAPLVRDLRNANARHTRTGEHEDEVRAAERALYLYDYQWQLVLDPLRRAINRARVAAFREGRLTPEVTPPVDAPYTPEVKSGFDPLLGYDPADFPSDPDPDPEEEWA